MNGFRNTSETNKNIDSLIKTLTSRQFDVLTCLLFNVTSKAIGNTLNIQYRTVQGHLQAICKKIGTSNKNELLKVVRLNSSPDLKQIFENRFKELTKEIPSNQKPNKRKESKSNDYSKRVIIRFLVILMTCIGLVWIYTIRSEPFGFSKINPNLYILKKEKDLKKLKKNNLNEFSIKVLYGCGGSGKTTLAREYLQRLSTNIKYEVNASSLETLSSELTGLAYALAKTRDLQQSLSFVNKITDPFEKLRQITGFIYTNLKDGPSWCILFDNVDDFRLLNQTCINTLPNLQHLHKGQILITTRNHDPKIFLEGIEFVKISPLTNTEKEKLFFKISKKRITSDIKLVLKDIPNYPLDVACFAYYVKNLHISGDSYFDQLHSGSEYFWNNSKKIIINNTDYPFTRQEISKSTLKKIMQTNIKFPKILFLMTCMNHTNIPITVFEDIFEEATLYELILALTNLGVATFFDRHLSFDKNWFEFTEKYFNKTISDKDKYENLSNLINHISPETLIKKGISTGEFQPHLNKILENIKINQMSKINITTKKHDL